MFSPKSITLLTLAANAVLGVPTWRRNNYPSPSEWKSKNLESYYRFKIRYRHIGCVEVEGTDFYNQCCVPLPKGQAVPEQCIPSACLAPTAAPTTPAPAPAPATTEAPAPAETPAPTEAQDGSDNSGDDGNGDEEDCEDDSGEDTGDDDSNLPYCDEVGGDYEPVPQPQSTTPAPAPEPTTTTEPEPATPAPEPEPTTTTEPEPATPAPEPEQPTTTTEPEPETPAPAPEPTTTAPDNNGGDNGGNNGGNNGGDDESVGFVNTGGFATWYEQDSNQSACGDVHTDDELIGAIQEQRYGPSSEHSHECGRRVRITNTNNGKSVDITIVDDCPTCEGNRNSIDLSLNAFDQIAEREEGRVPISWSFLS